VPEHLETDCLPRFIYGTAWKEDQTQRLVELAIEQGFRAIDTANQRRHYDEASVGRAIAAAMKRAIVSRDQLFMQTKFTFRAGQDERLPYDPSAPIATQVAQSFDSSLEHLGIEWIDSLVLHGPTSRSGLARQDWEAWQAMEAIYDRGRARRLGVSNMNASQLELLFEGARVKPWCIQNRCYASTQWDKSVREFCGKHNMFYQGFSLLTANRQILRHPQLAELARRYRRSIPQILFRFAIDVGIVPLTGTTSADHMREDLQVLNFRLEKDDVARIEVLS